MSSNMNNFTPLPGARRTGDRAYDVHTLNNSDSNEVPVFYRSHSTQTTVSIFSSCFSTKVLGHGREKKAEFDLCSQKQKLELSLFEDNNLFIILVRISRITGVQVR